MNDDERILLINFCFIKDERAIKCEGDFALEGVKGETIHAIYNTNMCECMCISVRIYNILVR